jgi:aryl-alcohol dehydrogenase-like predicted oxidoreductase
MVWGPLAGGWLSGTHRLSAAGSSALIESSRAGRFPARGDPSIPSNAAKLRAADALATLADEAGLTLIHLAIAFVLEHPAVSSAIIGPRTIEHLKSQLGAVELRLPTDLLDAIDAIVPPGTTFNTADLGVEEPGLAIGSRRRR